MCARYATLNIDLLNAFDHVGTLFDAIEGHKDAFKTSMEGIEERRLRPAGRTSATSSSPTWASAITLITDYDDADLGRTANAR